MKTPGLVFLLLVCTFPWVDCLGATLSLAGYLDQVRGAHQGYQGAVSTRDGALKGAVEGQTPFMPQLFATAQYTDDQRQTIVPVFQGDRTVTDQVQLGVRKLFDFGLQAQLSYNITQNSIFGVSPQLVPQDSLVTTGLSLQLTQSIWQNGFGAVDSAVARATEAQDRATAYNSAFLAKTTLADAETCYWNLAVAREMVRVQQESRDRTLRIRDFNVKRAQSHLIDRSDLLTSEAQAKSREFDLKSALDNERSVARAFNAARSIDSDKVNDALVLPEPEAIREIPIPKPSEKRDDVRAAEQTSLAAVASDDAARQKELPTLNLQGMVSTNGLDPSLGTSINDTFSTQHPYYLVGLNFVLPLAFGTVSTVRAAYLQQIKGAELTYRRKLFESENNWQDMEHKFQEAKDRLGLAVDVEQAQKIKFDHEKKRQREGLTTTYQVFQYELDYLNSEISRIQTEAVILGLIAQMKTYQGDL